MYRAVKWLHTVQMSEHYKHQLPVSPVANSPVQWQCYQNYDQQHTQWSLEISNFDIDVTPVNEDLCIEVFFFKVERPCLNA